MKTFNRHMNSWANNSFKDYCGTSYALSFEGKIECRPFKDRGGI